MRTEWPKWVRVYLNEDELIECSIDEYELIEMSTRLPKWEQIDLSTNWLRPVYEILLNVNN